MKEKKSAIKEFDVIAIIRRSLSEPLLLTVWLLISGIIGVVVAFNRQKEYTAQVVLAPEMSAGGLGMSESLSSMASTFGIDLGSKSAMDAIYPELYPTIFASNDFILSLFDVKVTLKETGQEKTYLNHLKEDYKMPFWQYPKSWLVSTLGPKDPGANKQDIDPFRLTRKQETLVDGVRNSIACLIDQKTSVITIAVTDIDPEVAAILADTLQTRLQNYITDYRTKKARKDLDYYNELTASSLKDYEEARDEYISYADTHMGSNLEAYNTRIEELESAMQLRYNIYTSMLSQAQNAQAKVQERIPAYTIVQNSTVPNKPSSLPRIYVLIIALFIGGSIQLFWVNWGRTMWRNRRKNKRKDKATPISSSTDDTDGEATDDTDGDATDGSSEADDLTDDTPDED